MPAQARPPAGAGAPGGAGTPAIGPSVVRVLPDVAAIDKEFDYLVPAALVGQVRVGSVVRIDLHGRRVGGWVVAENPDPPAGVALLALAKLTGWGPAAELIALAGWAAWRWVGRRSSLLKTASPDFAVRRLPRPAWSAPEVDHEAIEEMVAEATVGGVGILRLPPAADPTPVIMAVAQRGPTLVVTPSVEQAASVASRLRAAGAGVAVVPRDWPQARSGAAVVVGARAAAWAPCPGLAAVVVLDGHDQALAQEQGPTWNAVAVVAERARRGGVPCVVVSPCPSVELLAAGHLVRPSRDIERAGWAALEVIDRRHDDPRLGLYSARLVSLVRGNGRVLCVLNRKGRARLLACAACGELARCERCGSAVGQANSAPGGGPAAAAAADGGPAAAAAVPGGPAAAAAAARPIPLVCRRCGLARPPVCTECGSTVFKLLRVGVTRAREELEILAGRPVGEVSAATTELPKAEVLVGTEAVLHRADRADAVVFLDFDQELLAPRLRASEEAMALLARASRLLGGRGRGRLLVQTRLPRHPVIQAALAADPGRLADAEREIRRVLRFPPVTALATVSGEAAEAFVIALRARLVSGPTPEEEVEVLGPDRGVWLVRAPDHRVLADVLGSVRRPPGRLRLSVDPVRL